MQFHDSLGICRFNLLLHDKEGTYTLRALKAVTGWTVTQEEVLRTGRRALNLMRAFDIRHGLTVEKDAPSFRYGSAPVDGPAKGVSIMPHWDKMRGDLYEKMGWDRKTGKPSPEILKELGIEHVVNDIWK